MNTKTPKQTAALEQAADAMLTALIAAKSYIETFGVEEDDEPDSAARVALAEVERALAVARNARKLYVGGTSTTYTG